MRFKKKINLKKQKSFQYAYVERALNIIDSHDESKPLFLYFAAQNPHSDKNMNVNFFYSYFLFGNIF